MAYELICVFTLLSLVNCELDISALNEQIFSLANGELGVERFQKYLDDSVSYESSSQTAEQVRDTLAQDLSAKIAARASVVESLRDAIVQEFSNFGKNSAFDNCCQCCSESSYFGKLKFHTEVDTNTMCNTGLGTKSSSDHFYPNEAIKNLMKENLNNNPNLKWQFFGGEDGVMTIYPSSKMCDQTLDPRYRSWYIHSAFPTPKDVVVVIDRSGSMGNYDRDKTLMDIAKEAAETVVDTLTSDDRVGVVFFSTDAGTLNSGCFASQLAIATPENRASLKEYIAGQNANGNTNYGAAFQKAFQFFRNTPNIKNDIRKREKVILFLTDGRPTDSQYLQVIRNENAVLRNEVVILTFAFGDGIGSDEKQILESIANQDGFDSSDGPVQPGRFLYVEPSNLRYSMARYYDFFSAAENTKVSLSFPYLDAFGLGMVTSLCSPVHVTGTFRGVVCVDITLSDLYSDATYFSQGGLSYAFIMDGLSRLLIHPLLPNPAEIYDEPSIIHVTDMEVDEAMSNIIINRNFTQAGITSFSSRRVLSRGDSEFDGVNTIRVQSTYSWIPLAVGDLVLFVVVAGSDARRTVSSTESIDQFPYHRLDITEPDSRCRYLLRIASTEISHIKFAPFSFLSPDYYLESMETIDTVEQYDSYFAGTNDASFRAVVKPALAVSAHFDEVINNSEDAWQKVVWRYMGFREGVFRVFPGIKMVQKFDHTRRAWYRKALSNKDVLTFSKPYVDGFGAGIVITLSKALYEGKTGGTHGRDDETQGVLALDFTLDLFNSYLSKYIPDCSEKSCIVIDNIGNMISHPDFIQLSESEFPGIENSHITQKDPQIANDLFTAGVLRKDRCVNYKEKQIQSFWRITETSHVTEDYELQAIPGTNIFIILKKVSDLNSGSCSCRQKSGTTIPQCSQPNSECECPCYSRDGWQFDRCNGDFKFDTEIRQLPPCYPAVADIQLESVAEEEEDLLKDYQYCYPVDKVCPSKSDMLECSLTAGCQVCKDKCIVRGGDEKCNKKGNAGLIAGVTVAAIVVVGVIVGLSVYLHHKRQKNLNEARTSSSSRQQNRNTRAGTGSSAQGHDNVAVELERVPPTAPGYEEPHSSHPEPPPAYADSFHHPVHHDPDLPRKV